MFANVLIANRGEIACRIIRTARGMGIRAIVLHTPVDRGALFTRLADEAYEIGQGASGYLDQDAIIALARRVGAECLHPGYGFLSENADFAERCARAGVVFIGPPPAAMRTMGLKSSAKALMQWAGVPVVPGYHGDNQNPKFLCEKAYEIGYPVLIKAIAGGGGRGMRRVDAHVEFDAELESAIREAEAAFGDGRVLIEKYVASPRHIELQVFADAHGNCVHLFERDCSLQRRHQKVIEECPAPGLPQETRAAMAKAAPGAALAAGYVGAGTVEFIADASRGLRPSDFFFLEMNTRLQVEHPVTEAVTGLDLVEWQFRVAAGETLPLQQDRIRIDGHAIEARVYAEDVENGFLPSTGTIVALQLPDNVRVDSGVQAGGEVTPFYDPMIAKLIVHAPTRDAALDRLADVLDRTLIAGVRSNIAFLAALCRSDALRQAHVDTGFIDRNLAALGALPQPRDKAAAALGVAHLLTATTIDAAMSEGSSESPWAARDGFQLGGARSLIVPIVIDGEGANAKVPSGRDGAQVTVDGAVAATDGKVFEAGADAYVLGHGRQTRVRIKDFVTAATEASASDGVIQAPMHGKVLDILVGVGDRVSGGQRLAIIEAMKMEHTLRAPFAGIVTQVPVHSGVQVVEGAPIMVLEPAEQSAK